MRFDLGHGEQVGHGGRDLGHGGQVGLGGLGHGGWNLGGIGALDTNKKVEWGGVGCIEKEGLNEVDGMDSTAELNGHWEGSQFVQVCEGFDVEFWNVFDKGCRVGLGGCACDLSSVAATHRQVAVAHPQQRSKQPPSCKGARGSAPAS